jgi:hypothetical protein
MYDSPECELVAMLSRFPLTEAQRGRALGAIDSGVDWPRAFKLAEHWEVEPVFFANLAQIDVGMPDEITRLAKVNELRARSRATASALWTADVFCQLQAAGIPCILLKGPALGVLAYDNLSFRTFADADLLVEKKDLVRAGAHLRSLGFEPLFGTLESDKLIRNGHALEFANDSRKVELHWTLLSSHLALDLGVDELWTLAVPIEIAGRAVLTLDSSSLFLFLCAHGAKHEWARFRWVCDIAQLGDRLTNDEVARVDALAKRHHARRIVLLAMEMAQSLAASELTSLRSRSFGDARRVAPLVARAKNHYETLDERPPSAGPDDFSSRLAALRYWIGTRERLRDRALVLIRAFMSPVFDRGVNLPAEIVRRSLRLLTLVLRQPAS